MHLLVPLTKRYSLFAQNGIIMFLISSIFQTGLKETTVPLNVRYHIVASLKELVVPLHMDQFGSLKGFLFMKQSSSQFDNK